ILSAFALIEAGVSPALTPLCHRLVCHRLGWEAADVDRPLRRARLIIMRLSPRCVGIEVRAGLARLLDPPVAILRLHSRAYAGPARHRKIKRYGWIPHIPDQRDYPYAAPPAFLRALPARIDLRKQCPPVYDQGQLGSCTANAIGGAIEFDQMKEKLPQIFIPSRLFVYYNERVIEGTVNTDAGAMLRDGIKTVAK